MKKLVKSVLMLSIASLAILSSCKKDDDNADVTDVKVDISSSPASPVVIGTPYKVTIVCTGNTDNKLKSISVTRTATGMSDKVMLSTSLTGTSSTQEVWDTPGVEGSYTYTAAITGEKGSPATKNITVTVIPAPGGINKTANPVPLFAQQNDPGVNENFMNLSTFATYDNSEFTANKANIDLVFYYGNSNKATLCSPSDNAMQTQIYSGLNWTGTNTTQLYKTSLTVAQYNAIANGTTDTELTTMAAGVSAWSSTMTQLAVDNIILFKTAAGKIGLIRVNTLTGNSSTDGSVDISVVVQD